jgi:hypothetical protein
MRLTNLDISNDYRHVTMWLMRKDFTGMFARWVVEQSPYEVPNIGPALVAYNNYITEVMGGETCKEFSYDELNALITEDVFMGLPQVAVLNEPLVSSGAGYANRHEKPHPDYDFIDLGALARNIFYSMVRSYVNWAEDEEAA